MSSSFVRDNIPVKKNKQICEWETKPFYLAITPTLCRKDYNVQPSKSFITCRIPTPVHLLANCAIPFTQTRVQRQNLWIFFRYCDFSWYLIFFLPPPRRYTKSFRNFSSFSKGILPTYFKFHHRLKQNATNVIWRCTIDFLYKWDSGRCTIRTQRLRKVLGINNLPWLPCSSLTYWRSYHLVNSTKLYPASPLDDDFQQRNLPAAQMVRITLMMLLR